ncbi:aromatic amino acid aminotransferase [Shewanella sp. OPT22]|nr:aromatic amino acid aminotransferase [Shewanella sp. OPT22]
MIFSTVEQAPADPLFGLNDAFKADQRPEKVNLGIGVYKADDGTTPILDAVKTAEARLLETEKTKVYLGIEGESQYNLGVQKLLFGENSELLSQQRVETLQAPGGTGALRLGAEFLIRQTKTKTIWVSNPTWANHSNIFSTAGFEIKQYDYYDSDSHGLDFEGMISSLSNAKAGDIVLFHGCCHNPTGIDLNAEQWNAIAIVCVEKQLVPFFDFAYQGFGNGIEEDAQGLRIVAAQVPELLVANSFSKNFGLYNERIGAVTLVAENTSTAQKSYSQIKRIVRAMYSNPPAHGALIVSTILNDAELTMQWHNELKQMRERIAQMRQLFVNTLKAEGVTQDFSFISDQIGMFSFSGLTKEQVEKLKSEYGVYIVGSGRISVAGMTTTNIPVICKAIAQVL